jgi:hypothetical protein
VFVIKPPFNRHRWLVRLAFVLAMLVLASVGLSETNAPRQGFVNPICEQADPWIVQAQGRYLSCFAEGNHAISTNISDRLT